MVCYSNKDFASRGVCCVDMMTALLIDVLCTLQVKHTGHGNIKFALESILPKLDWSWIDVRDRKLSSKVGMAHVGLVELGIAIYSLIVL